MMDQILFYNIRIFIIYSIYIVCPVARAVAIYRDRRTLKVARGAYRNVLARRWPLLCADAADSAVRRGALVRTFRWIHRVRLGPWVACRYRSIRREALRAGAPFITRRNGAWRGRRRHTTLDDHPIVEPEEPYLTV